MDRRFLIVLDVPDMTEWRCVGCQVRWEAHAEPTVKACSMHGVRMCGSWLRTEMMDVGLPLGSSVRRVIEEVVRSGWGRIMASSCEPQIRIAVNDALRANIARYAGYTMDWEHQRHSALFTVSIECRDPIRYRYAWPNWKPTP